MVLSRETDGEKGESEDASSTESSVLRSAPPRFPAVDSGFHSFGCFRIESDGALAGCLSIRFVAKGSGMKISVSGCELQEEGRE